MEMFRCPVGPAGLEKLIPDSSMLSFKQEI